MNAAFLLDEQISPRVAEQAENLGVDVRAVCGSELSGLDDRGIFRAAIKEGRIVVTYNIADFSAVYADLLKEGLKIPGLVLVSEDSIPNADIQRLVRALTRLAAQIDKGEVDVGGGLFLT